MTSTAASSRDTSASMVAGCRSVTSFTWPPSVQAVTVPPSKPSTNASSPPTKNPRSSSWPSCEKCSQPSTLCSAIVLHGSRDPPEPTTQLLIQRRRIVNFLHGPSCIGKPPPSIQNSRLDLARDLPPCRSQAQCGMKWHGRPFQRRGDRPRISWIGSRHGRQTDTKILDGTCHGAHHVHQLSPGSGLGQ